MIGNRRCYRGDDVIVPLLCTYGRFIWYCRSGSMIGNRRCYRG